MSNVSRSQAIKNFLTANTWPDLAELYNKGLECQVNVAKDGGEKVDRYYRGRDFHEFTDGIQSWKSFRIPYNAMENPEDNDHEIKFDLSLHVEGIGLTGWNWLQKRSLWVAFDFDAIVGHSDKHQKKLTDQQLEEIKEKVSNIEWVTLRKSTGGKGLHIYVFLGTIVETVNHNEHMALGRAVLSQLSAMAGFDFESKVDTNSGNLWVWHRRMVAGEGLSLLKQGGKLFTIPPNWRDYLDVVKGRRRRVIPFFVKEAQNPEQAYDEFEAMSNQRPKVQLDTEHRRLIEWFEKNRPGGSWWNDSHWMLVTHTLHLKAAHTALGLRGIFETNSEGTNLDDQNCFAFPLINGGWSIRRYTKGVIEHPTWTQDGQGYTRCVYNKAPDLRTICLANGGVELEKGGYGFTKATEALKVAKMFGVELELEDSFRYRPAVLKQHKDKRLIIQIEKMKSDTASALPGFDGQGKMWARIFATKEEINSAPDTLHLDKLVRHIVNEGGRDEGWVIRNDNIWREEPLEHLKLVLKGEFQFKPSEVEQILGSGAYQPYTLVNRPFDVEYPPGRLWNRRGAKLRFEPSSNIDNLKFPTWIKVFEHLGRNLNPYVEINPWAQANNIRNGTDYLFIWAAALFQHPYERLPYLFFWSDAQNTGKSTFHEALSILMDGSPPRGYMKVNEALKAQATFNAELHHSILCVVEELDLNPKRADAKISYNRIKELVTAPMISIHEKRQTPCMVVNTTHWIQCANDRSSCPIFKNDSRITMIHVGEIDPIDMIPKTKLLGILEKEAPDFLAYILRLEIPTSGDRLLVPVIETEDKRTIQDANLTLVEQFIKEHCHVVDGETILWSEFYSQFEKTLESADIEKWTKRYTGFHLPEYHPRARRKQDTQYCISNLSWTARDPESPVKDRLIVKGDYLVPINNQGLTNGQQNQRSVPNSDNRTAGDAKVSP